MTDTLELRIICLQPPPDNCRGEPAHRFGLQDKKGILNDGIKQSDGLRLFACEVTPKLNGTEIDFSGPYVQGAKGSRFLYLSWAYDAGGWVKRIKIPLSGITAQQIDGSHVLQTVIGDGQASGTVKLGDGWKTV